MCKLLVRLLLLAIVWCPFQAYSTESGLSPKIIGGINSSVNELPWQAYLNMTFPDGDGGSTFICGGAVISENVVLTAAHCLRHGETTVEPQNVKVWAGIISLFMANSFNAVSVSEVIIHPSYNSSRLANDIAIIKLASPLPTLAKPILMADQITQNRVDNAFANGWVDNAEREANLLVSGWGSADLTNLSLGSLVLQQTLLSGVPDSICDSPSLWGNNINPDDYPIYLCAGSVSPDKGRDSCFGDSGGPLVWQDPQAASDSDFGLRLVGLVSFGRDGCAGDLPGVYTEVAHFQEWIQGGVGILAQATPIFELNPFNADYSNAGVDVPVAGSSGSGGSSVSDSSGGIAGWWSLLGLLIAGYIRRPLLLSKSKVGQDQG